jgi:hypothetical protein
MNIFSPSGGVSVAIKPIFGDKLENGKRYAKHVTRILIGRESVLGFQMKIFLLQGGAAALFTIGNAT